MSFLLNYVECYVRFTRFRQLIFEDAEYIPVQIDPDQQIRHFLTHHHYEFIAKEDLVTHALAHAPSVVNRYNINEEELKLLPKVMKRIRVSSTKNSFTRDEIVEKCAHLFETDRLRVEGWLPYLKERCPKTKQTRFLSEDVSFSTKVMSGFGLRKEYRAANTKYRIEKQDEELIEKKTTNCITTFRDWDVDKYTVFSVWGS